jgi:hypothetical protein
MAHWKKFMDKELLGAHDLDGKDVNIVIVEVTGGSVGHGKQKNKRPVATIASMSGKRLEKKLALNVTNCTTLQQLSGSPDVDQWRNLAVTVYPAMTQFGNDTVPCVRIRPTAPRKATTASSAEPEPAIAEPTSDDDIDVPGDE